MGRVLLRIVAEVYALSPEYLKNQVSFEELINEEDTIYNAKAMFCHMINHDDVLPLLFRAGWSCKGCLKLIDLDEDDMKEYRKYYNKVLAKYKIHNVKVNRILKRFKLENK